MFRLLLAHAQSAASFPPSAEVFLVAPPRAHKATVAQRVHAFRVSTYLKTLARQVHLSSASPHGAKVILLLLYLRSLLDLQAIAPPGVVAAVLALFFLVSNFSCLCVIHLQRCLTSL